MDENTMVTIPKYLWDALGDVAKDLASIYGMGIPMPVVIESEVQSDLHCLARSIKDAKQRDLYPK